MDNNSKNPNILSSIKKEEKVQIELNELKNYEQKTNDELNNNSNNKKENNIEEKPKEDIENKKEITTNNNDIDNKNEKTMLNNEENSIATVGKKAMEIILLNLNLYWIEFIGSVCLIISIIVFELIGIIIFNLLNSIIDISITKEEISDTIDIIFRKIGLKWYVFIEISQHLSIGFFCLTTFSEIFKAIQSIKKFYILNFIKVAVYYAASVVFLKVVIKDGIKNLIKDKINKERESQRLNINQESLDKIYIIIDKIINKILFYITDFLSTFNIFLEKLVLGSLYIFLLITPNNCLNKKLIYFRLLSIILILFIIISVVLRALHKSEILILNEYISPILLGPKITIS